MPAVQPPMHSERRRLLAEGAVALLARQGARGLTHRRLDRSLGLPEGSTSNAFPTLDALFSAALASLAEPTLATFHRLAETLPTTLTPDDAARLYAEHLHVSLEPAERPRLTARFELIMEAARRPALQQTLVEIRRALADVTRGLSAAAGAHDPDATGGLLVSLADGILIAHLTGQQDPPGRRDTERAALALLRRP